MMTPQKASGSQATGKAKVMMAMHVLQLSMLDFGAASPEGQAIFDAIKPLVKKFGKSEDESKQLMPAEMMAAMQQGAGPGAPPGAKPPGAPPPGGAPPM